MKKKLMSGILVTMFLVTMITIAFPARVSASALTVKIGVVGPKGWIQWDGVWEAAQLARDMINKKSGTEFGPGGAYYWPGGPSGMLTVDGVAQVELVDIDEHAVPTPDPTAGIAELLSKVEANPDMKVLVGGFRSEVLTPMSEALMDWAPSHNGPIWLIAGASTEEVIWGGNYDRYKYMFRVTPLNVTALFEEFLFGILKQIIAPKVAALYYVNPATLVPTYIIAENLHWCDLMETGITAYGASAGLLIKGSSRPSPLATDFSTEIATASASGAKLIIHIFSAVAGANFIKQYGDLAKAGAYHMACVGINVESQMQEFYTSVSGACEYETFLATVNTQEGLTNAESVNPNAKPLTSNVFWDIYKARYGHAPIYTAWGAYEGIMSLNETAYDPVGSGHASAGKGWTVHVKNGNVTGWIEHTETQGVSDGFAWKRDLIGGSYYRSNMVGEFRFTGQNGKLHDVFCSMYSLSAVDDGVVRASIPQWQAGRLESTFPRDRLYSRKWMFPSWMYTLETDFAGGTLVDAKVPNPATPGSNFTYTTPDRTVNIADLNALTSVWFQKPPFTLLEADISPQNHFIDVYDAAKLGKDWNKIVNPQ